jgi:hypothetical protein
MPDSMPEASPTLMLMPGQGFDSTVALQVRLSGMHFESVFCKAGSGLLSAYKCS